VSLRIPAQHPAILGDSIGQGTSMRFVATQIVEILTFRDPEED
jgi:hypothetical protein